MTRYNEKTQEKLREALHEMKEGAKVPEKNSATTKTAKKD